jgi:cytoskeletal protein CcmA (bactofilin family)
MWINKKADRSQAANPEPTNLQTNQPLKPARAIWERTTEVNKDASRPTEETDDRPTSRLASSLHVKGEISGNADLVIDGSVEGLIQLDERKLTIGTTAKVVADIIAGEVVVFGKMKGDVRAKGRIEIKRDGSVDGDLTTAQIMIEDGADFKGSIEIERSAEKHADKSVFPPAA